MKKQDCFQLSGELQKVHTTIEQKCFSNLYIFISEAKRAQSFVISYVIIDIKVLLKFYLLTIHKLALR